MTPNSVKAQCATSLAVGIALALSGVPASRVDAQDTLAALAKRDRIRYAMLTDVTIPPEGIYQFATNRAFFERLRWQNYEDWMFTDDQRFDVGDTFGPRALIAPSDNLETYTEAQFAAASTGGLLVGAALVDTIAGATLPENYSALNLVAGRSCIRLGKIQEQWVAYVYPEPELTIIPCPVPSQLPKPLKVIRVGAKPNAGGANIPAVARWHEGRRNNADRMHFGLKCADYWCMVLPLQADTLGLPHKGDRPHDRTWETHGWHDVQRLAVVNTAGRAVPSRLKASIMPHPQLGTFKTADFDTGWVHVATVVIRGPLNGRAAKYGRPPSSTERGYWGFLQGENDLYLRTTTDLATYPKGWMAEVRHPHAGAFELVVVERHGHSHHVPGTARFRWIEHDDGGWIRCDDGCCKIGAM